jgi:acyl-CoA synthetase (AMP-forming)/AMP-acid ligase II
MPSGEDTGAIVFTTGSTGVPKGVVYTHHMFNSQIELMRDQFEIEPGETELATFPLFALFDPALRVTTVFPKMDFTRPGRVDPREILNSIQEHECTHMFGSPALLDRVGRYAENRTVRLPTLRRVLTAGAPVSSKILRRFAELLEGDADIHTPYGATEALPVCSITSREVLLEDGTEKGKGVCVGRPLRNIRLEIIEITDDPIERWTDGLAVPPGVVGEIVVWGPNVSKEYFELPQANKEAKILSSEGMVGHRMGDLGYLDELGRVWFCGRKSHRVVTPAGTLFTVPCEGVFNQHRAVHRSALVGLGDPPNQEALLCVELEPEFKGTRQLEKEILALGASLPQTKTIKRLLFHPSFPVDIRHNAKIFREKLARWAAGRVP